MPYTTASIVSSMLGDGVSVCVPKETKERDGIHFDAEAEKSNDGEGITSFEEEVKLEFVDDDEQITSFEIDVILVADEGGEIF